MPITRPAPLHADLPAPAAAPTRRRLLRTGAGLLAWVMLRPAVARDSLAAMVEAYADGAPVQQGKVDFDIAPLVENGNAVPITISVASPMTDEAHVQAIVVFNELNPQGEVARLTLGPRAGHAQVSLRIRLANSQKLVAIARMNDGSLWSSTVDVIVTLAACVEPG